jgi:hypothetical protein
MRTGGWGREIEGRRSCSGGFRCSALRPVGATTRAAARQGAATHWAPRIHTGLLLIGRALAEVGRPGADVYRYDLSALQHSACLLLLSSSKAAWQVGEGRCGFGQRQSPHVARMACSSTNDRMPPATSKISPIAARALARLAARPPFVDRRRDLAGNARRLPERCFGNFRIVQRVAPLSAERCGLNGGRRPRGGLFHAAPPCCAVQRLQLSGRGQ